MGYNFIASFLEGVLEKERLEKERLDRERLDRERLEKEKLEKERLEKERLEKEKLEKERLEKERLDREKEKEIIRLYNMKENNEINLKEKTDNIKEKIDLEEKSDTIKKIENDIGKEIIGYLDTNTDLDNSLLKMDIGKELEQGVDLKNKSVKEIKKKSVDIKIVKNKKKSVNLLWILFEFIVGILLIIFSLSYINKNEAESKFLSSSVQLWKNTAINLIGKIGFMAKDVEGEYIKKREIEINNLMNLETKLQSCIKNEQDNNKRKELKDILNKVSSFKYQIMDTKLVTLDDFIKNYDKFSLYGYGLKQTTDKVCDK